jgi:hypothetical protein
MEITRNIANKQLTAKSVLIGVLMCFTFAITINAQNTSTGYKQGGASRNVALSGGSLNWTALGNAMTDDNLYGTAGATLGSGATIKTNALEVDGFGNSVPDNAVILGIEATVVRTTNSVITSGGIKDGVVKLTKAGSLIGTNKAGNTDWSFGNAAIVYGGPTDLWGSTWTPAEINAPTFGMGVSANLYTGLVSLALMAKVDNIKINVFYFVPVPLPLEISSFAGTSTIECAELVWTTATEYNADYFVIEKKIGLDFIEISRVNAVGNSTKKNHYTITDCDLEKFNYYRLVQVNTDGNEFYYDEILSVSRMKAAPGLLTENPTDGKAIYKASGKILSCDVFDPSGKAVKKVVIEVSGNMADIDLSEANKGMYFVLVSTEDGTKMERIIKK